MFFAVFASLALQGLAQDSLSSFWDIPRASSYTSVGLGAGLNGGYVVRETGPSQLIAQQAIRYELEFNRVQQINRPWSVNFKGGLGALPMWYYQAEQYRTAYYISEPYYLPYLYIQGGLERKFWVTERHRSSLGIHVGAQRFFPVREGFQKNLTIGFQDSVSILMRTMTPRFYRQTFYLRATASREFKLANNNILKLTLGGHVNFKRAFTADYILYPDSHIQSTGSYTNQGNALYASLTYGFTGITNYRKKSSLAERLGARGGRREIKNELRNEKEDFRRDAWTVSTFFGSSSTYQSETGDPLNLVEDSPGGGGNYGFKVSRMLGAKNEIIIGFTRRTHYLYTDFTTSGPSVYYLSTGLFETNGIGLEYGRWMYLGKHRILRITGGVNMEFIDNSVGYGRSDTGSVEIRTIHNGKQLLWSYTESVNPRNVYSMMLGVHRDFRISKRFYFESSILYNQGLRQLYTSTFEYYYENEPKSTATLTYQGSMLQLHFGLKYLVGRL